MGGPTVGKFLNGTLVITWESKELGELSTKRIGVVDWVLGYDDPTLSTESGTLRKNPYAD